MPSRFRMRVLHGHNRREGRNSRFCHRWASADKTGKRGIAEIGAAPLKRDFAELAVLAVPENDSMPRLQLASARTLCVGDDQPLAEHRIMTFGDAESVA